MDPAAPETSPLLIAGYPLWLVGLVAGLAFTLICWLLARTFRVLAALVAIAVLAGACVLAWQHVFS